MRVIGGEDGKGTRDSGLTTREWLAQLKGEEPLTGVSREDILEAIHQGREERDEQIRAALSMYRQ